MLWNHGPSSRIRASTGESPPAASPARAGAERLMGTRSVANVKPSGGGRLTFTVHRRPLKWLEAFKPRSPEPGAWSRLQPVLALRRVVPLEPAAETVQARVQHP